MRELTAQDFLWATDVGDFPSPSAMRQFLRTRRTFLAAAERAGIPKEAFLPFAPNKPGFEARVKKALGDFLADPTIAAE
ncbi:MAG: hypothetical protein AAFY59_16375 [Pseudomonadota bacterium]